MKSKLLHLRSIFFAIAGFTLWVCCDSCMKLAGESHLPPYEVVGFLGLVAALSLVVTQGFRGKMTQLWPKHPMRQLPRVLMVFGCVMGNAMALKHLPLTTFYVVIFTSPMMIAILASLFLKEHLDWPKIAAIVIGFAGVVLAIDPWNSVGSGDWTGYIAAVFAAFFYAAATVLMRAMTATESALSMSFMTAICEAALGFGLTLWHGMPVALPILGIMVLMGVLNVTANMFNSTALKHTDAATVEQFHYTQIVMGAVLGYLIWGDVPTHHMLMGSAIIIASGLYIAISLHHAEKRKVSP